MCEFSECNKDGHYEIVLRAPKGGDYIWTGKLLCDLHYEQLYGKGAVRRYEDWLWNKLNK